MCQVLNKTFINKITIRFSKRTFFLAENVEKKFHVQKMINIKISIDNIAKKVFCILNISLDKYFIFVFYILFPQILVF